VSVEDQTCTGVGPNKKLAKRHAAEAMLQLLGYSRPSPQPSKPSIKSPTGPEVRAHTHTHTHSHTHTHVHTHTHTHEHLHTHMNTHTQPHPGGSEVEHSLPER
jgi:hypothetical protein